MDGNVDISRVTEEIIVPADGSEKYSLRISYTDRAGNVMEETVELSLADGLRPTASTRQVDNTATAAAGSAEVTTTTTTTTTLDIPANAGYRNDLADQVLALINNERASAGLGALSMNGGAQQAAGVRAVELLSDFSHTRPDGAGCYTALDQAGVGYSAAGENIAAGQSSASAVVKSWMNSAGHRDNILNGNYSEVGIACYYDPGTPYLYYWVQLFIG